MNVKKIIEFIELYKEIVVRPDSMMNWYKLEDILPGVKITSYKVRTYLGHDVESISWLILDPKSTKEQPRGWRYTVHIPNSKVGEEVKTA